ncbi:MAG: DUF4080 domain-containing protein [Candidatus Competibacteraceae bacterium]
MAAILLSTLNARYFHASLGLRYLLANMEELRTATQLLEFIITQPPIDIVASLLEQRPRIIGFGVYIWNVEETTKVVSLLKQIRPDIPIVLGGPEVSYESTEQTIVQLADYVITGPADIGFVKLCRQILANEPSAMKIIPAETVPLTQLRFPYHEYTLEDIAHRLIYVEASRGCPFKCEFCLSSLDKTAKSFALERFLEQIQDLYHRGARQFKFVDRTFNLNIDTGIRILEFFLERLDERLFLHFELIPDHLPDRLKTVIARFPPGSLQFEIGIQSFNPTVQALISRKQDNRKTEENLVWLRQHSQAHLHADLIVGLPGEDIESFGTGFNRLVALNPHEIQVGILKRLRGTPITRYTAGFGIKYNPYPPYNLLCSNLIDFTIMRRLEHFARYWDMIANSGRFHHTRPVLLGDNPFERFLRFSDWLFATTRQTHQIALERLFDLVYRGLLSALAVEQDTALAVLTRDYQDSGTKGHPAFIRRDTRESSRKKRPTPLSTTSRQIRHSKKTESGKPNDHSKTVL